jgi:cyanate permease
MNGAILTGLWSHTVSKKKQQQASPAGVYALCITIGLIVGLGLAPVMGNLLVMVVIGAAGGALAAYLINRKNQRSHAHPHHHRHHH